MKFKNIYHIENFVLLFTLVCLCAFFALFRSVVFVLMRAKDRELDCRQFVVERIWFTLCLCVPARKCVHVKFSLNHRYLPRKNKVNFAWGSTKNTRTHENSLLFAVRIKYKHKHKYNTAKRKSLLRSSVKGFYFHHELLMTDIQHPSAMYFNVLKLLQEKLVYFSHVHCCMLTICFLRIQ